MRFTTPQPRWRSEPERLRTGLICPEPVGAQAIATADSRVSSNGRYCFRSLPYVASVFELSVSSTKRNVITVPFPSRPRWATFKRRLLRAAGHRFVTCRIRMPGWKRVVRNANITFSDDVHCWSRWYDFSMKVAGSTRVSE